MSAPVMPPAGSRVRVVVRGVGEFFGDVIPAKTQSGRLPVAPWGLAHTYCLDHIEEIEVVEMADRPGDFVASTSVRQRDGLHERYVRARRGVFESASRKGLGPR